MEPRIIVAHGGDGPGVKRTLCWDGSEDCAVGGVCRGHLHIAVVRTISLAACRKIRVEVRGESEQRRDQWCVEEEQQRDGQEASHGLIVQAKRC